MPAAPDVPPAETSAGADALEARIGELRAAVRRAIANGDRQAARVLRSELRRAEEAWDEAVLGSGPGEDVRRPLVPVRDQVHQALTLLGVPAAPKLIGSVYAAFFPGEVSGTRLTSLRRDEERSFRTAPYARPYYLCPALTADLLAPARGLLTVSTWPQAQRIVGPLSARADFLSAAVRVAEQAGRGPDDSGVQRLLWRFAANIPGATAGTVGTVDPAVLAEAAQAELDVHVEADRHQRERAAERAQAQLDDAGRLFGSRLHALRRTGNGSGNGPDGENKR
ncbi:hypothetical protein [Actinomadura sp. 6N118]|uniref:hypothetical protein n=1 Tax=Actinomadura sp. 6N118 TaxID=3375151 RepID=UPI00379B3168